ncbi:MAG: hypothetical protein ACKERG_02785 [Candidatus Hodgkinia cicadicola]
MLGVRELVGSRTMIQAAGLHLLFDVKPLLSRGLSYYNGSAIELSSSVVCLNARNCFVKIESLMAAAAMTTFKSWSWCRMLVWCDESCRLLYLLETKLSWF